VSGDYKIGGKPFALDSREREWLRVRGSEIGMIMQDPFTALEPLTKCGRQILAGVPDGLRADFDVKAALAEVGLGADVTDRYPFELSGGMRQRVVIAAALATQPKLLIADEATTALDVVTQKEILDLIDDIRQRRNMPLIMITHDVRLIYQRTEYVIVFDKGRIIETGRTRDVIENPKEEYTKKLVRADRYLNIKAYPEYAVGGEIILKASGIVKRFGEHTALSDVSIEVGAGECVGVVGQSGSGKTTLARCIAGLTKPDGGTIKFFGKVSPQIVFQDPYSSLNPSHTVRYILTEALAAAGRPSEELAGLLDIAEIPVELTDRKPASLSGGQRQRVAIARALAPRPELLICDESVSALDVVIQNQILGTLERLRKDRGLAVLFITHDLSVVRVLASRIYVMNEAKVVNEGSTEYIFEEAGDDYTKSLIAASAIGVTGDGYTGRNAQATESALYHNERAAAPTLYRNAKIYTVSGRGWDESPEEAMAVDADGRILYVWSEE
jgi:peptide/nickel transport system ATP-binding protein